MSLTELVQKPDVKAQFLKYFRPPVMERVPADKIKAKPITKNYSLVGTAFDYLLRFYVERLNPHAQTEQWVAKTAFNVMGVLCLPVQEIAKAEKIIELAQMSHDNYLKTGKITERLLSDVLKLAQLDVVWRAGVLPRDFGVVDPGDICDLKNLLAIVPKEQFISYKNCKLNTNFGDISRFVGGADIDIFIDNTLIDIKTVKDCKFTVDFFVQLMGYYVLNLLCYGNDPNNSIDSLSIYFSRYGHFFKFSVTDTFIYDNIEPFLNWFIKRVEKQYGVKLYLNI